jgi:hypothetical protein
MPSIRTECFGRYLVDLPTVSKIIGYGNKYISSEIVLKKITKIEFDDIVRKRHDELNAPQEKDDQKLRVVGFSDSKTKRLFMSYANVFGGDNFEIDTFNYAMPNVAFFSSAQAVSARYIDNIQQKYVEYLNNVNYRSDKSIPHLPGFCFKDGFVANDGLKPQYELITLAFELKDHPDVHIVVESEVLFSKTDSLIDRTGKSGLFSLFDGFTTLRKRERNVNGMVGEEVLTRFKSDEGGNAHKFRWETMGELSNPLKPDIYIDFQTGFKPGGGSVNSSLSDKEAIALFDRIVSSIRIRPVSK